MTDTLQNEENPRTTLIYAPDGLENVKDDEIHVFEPYKTPDLPDRFGFDNISSDTLKKLLASDQMRNAYAYLGSDKDGIERMIEGREKILVQENKEYRYNKSDHKNLSIGKAAQAGNTVLEKNFNIEALKTGNILLDGKMYRTGITHSTEKQVEHAKNIANNEKVVKKIESIKNKRYGNTTGTKKETHNAKESIKSLTDKEREKLVEYSGLSHKSYAARAHGYDNYNYGYARVTEEEVMELNGIIKKVEKDTNIDSRFLYRGSQLPKGMSSQDFLDQYSPGDVVVTNKITSTTRSGKIMNKFSDGDELGYSGKPVNYIYHTKKGAYINSISRYDDEKEVLLGIGEKMVVVDKGHDKSGKPFIVFADSQEE